MSRSDEKPEIWAEKRAAEAEFEAKCWKSGKNSPVALTEDEVDELKNALETIRTLSFAVENIAVRQANVSLHATGGRASKASAPLPVNVNAAMVYWSGVTLLCDAMDAAEIPATCQPNRGPAATFRYDYGGAVNSVESRMYILANLADERHGDPHTWLDRFRDLARRMERLTTVPDEPVTVGVCPHDGGRVVAELDGKTGKCLSCWREMPVVASSGELFRRAAQDFTRRSQSNVSRLLAMGGVRVPQSTIASWVRRGKLDADEKGRVCLRDVLKLVGR